MATPANPLIELTDANFDDVIKQADIMLIDFWASWCEPCKAFAPVFAQAAQAYPDITFGKVNIEQETQLAADFAVRSVPLIVVLREQVVIYSEAGAMTKAGLDELIQQARAVDMQAVREKIKAQQQQQDDN